MDLLKEKLDYKILDLLELSIENDPPDKVQIHLNYIEQTYETMYETSVEMYDNGERDPTLIHNMELLSLLMFNVRMMKRFKLTKF